MKHGAVAIAASLILMTCAAAQGAGYSAAIEVRDGKDSQSAKDSKSTTALSTLAKRVVLEGSAESLYTVVWKVVRTDQTTTKDELVHCYVVKMDRQGQAPPALEPAKVVLESAVTMDFPPGDTSSGTQQFRVDGPGIYLVRVEVGVDPDKPGSADYAELELVVK